MLGYFLDVRCGRLQLIDRPEISRLWQTAYGPVKPNSSVYKREYPDISKIKVPVLVLQGTGDKHIPWKTVQTFVKEMKSAGKIVRFKLYPGGIHGLGGKYVKDKSSEVNTWFMQYGLNLF